MLLPDGKIFLNFDVADTDRIKFASLLNLEASQYEEDANFVSKLTNSFNNQLIFPILG